MGGGALVVALVVTAVVLTRGDGGSSSGTGQAASTAPQHVDRPDLGFSLDLPASWIVDVDQTPGSVFYAHSVPPKSSVRIFRSQTRQPLEDTMVNVVDGLREQGASDFSQHPVAVGGLSGIRLDYVAADGPAGTTATHSSYRVKKGDALFAVSVATTDRSSDDGVLSGIASSFRLL